MESILPRDGQCHATVKFSPIDEFTKQFNDHTQTPSFKQVEVTKIKLDMKPKAKTTEERVHQILGKQMRNTSEDAAAYLPLIATTRQNSRKAQKVNDVPQIPVNRQDNPILPKGTTYPNPGSHF